MTETRRLVAGVAASLVLVALPQGAAAHGTTAAGGLLHQGSSEVETHGPDRAAIDSGGETAGPTGGRRGRPLSGTARAAAAGGDVSSSLPSRWCGEERSADDTVNELDNGGPSYHGVYMLPSDGASRFRSVASTLQTDAMQASALLERLYGRAIRFDMGTTCGPQYLDLTIVRMSQSTDQLLALAPTPDDRVEAIRQALDRAGFPTAASQPDGARLGIRHNYLVWLDAAATPGFCGEAETSGDARRAPDNAHNSGGRVAVIFRATSGFCGSNTVRHEIGHNLGALQRGAPNAFDAAHCDDSYEDTMCYPAAPRTGNGSRGGEFFDYKNDDYWDPEGGALPWWTVNLSAFLCPDAACNVPTGYEPDRDGDHEPDTSDNCPDASNPGQVDSFGDARGDACEPFSGRLRMTVKRDGRHWMIRLIAAGDGAARLTVTCRRGSRRTALLRRTIDLPNRVRMKARCNARPRARLVADAP